MINIKLDRNLFPAREYSGPKGLPLRLLIIGSKSRVKNIFSKRVSGWSFIISSKEKRHGCRIYKWLHLFCCFWCDYQYIRQIKGWSPFYAFSKPL